jgi:hypothetical protein
LISLFFSTLILSKDFIVILNIGLLAVLVLVNKFLLFFANCFIPMLVFCHGSPALIFSSLFNFGGLFNSFIEISDYPHDISVTVSFLLINITNSNIK